METIEDIVREMRAIDYGIIENPFVQFANCIEAAAKELKKETEEKSILEMAYDIHMKIMSKNQWCYGDNECDFCDVRCMCQAASKLRDEIFKHDSKEVK